MPRRTRQAPPEAACQIFRRQRHPNSDGLAFDPGYQNGMATLAFSGPIYQLNTVLMSLLYTANAGVTNDCVSIVAVDLSNPGAPVIAPKLMIMIGQ